MCIHIFQNIHIVEFAVIGVSQLRTQYVQMLRCQQITERLVTARSFSKLTFLSYTYSTYR